MMRHDQLAAGQRPAEPGSVHAVTWPLHRFVGVRDFDDGDAAFLTPPFAPTEFPLHLDADIRGRVHTELCDTFGRPISGLPALRCTLEGNDTAHRLTWGSDLAQRYRHDFLRLRLKLQDATVYSVWW